MVLRIDYQGSVGQDVFHARAQSGGLHPGAARTNTDRRRPRPEFRELTLCGADGGAGPTFSDHACRARHAREHSSCPLTGIWSTLVHTLGYLTSTNVNKGLRL